MASPEEIAPITSVDPLVGYYENLVDSLRITKHVGGLLVGRIRDQLAEQEADEAVPSAGIPPAGFGMQVHLLVADLERGVDQVGRPLSGVDALMAQAALRDKAGLHLGMIRAARTAYGDAYGIAVHDWFIKAFRAEEDSRG